MTRVAVLSLATVLVAMLVGNVGLAEEVAIGAEAPDFKATGVDGKQYSLASTKNAKATVLCFTCNGCPVAKAYEGRLIEFTKEYGDKSVKLIALNCNNKTEDLDKMKQRAEEKGFNFPYAFDETGDAAEAYGARVTPHLFVIDGKGKVAYRGAFDDSQNTDKVKATYVADAVDALLAGKTPETTSTKAFGCGIKLKK